MGPELGAIMLVRPPIVVYGYVVTVATIKGSKLPVARHL